MNEESLERFRDDITMTRDQIAVLSGDFLELKTTFKVLGWASGFIGITISGILLYGFDKAERLRDEMNTLQRQVRDLEQTLDSKADAAVNLSMTKHEVAANLLEINNMKAYLGKGVSIFRNEYRSTDLSSFSIGGVRHNTLLEKNPSESTIAAPVGGTYLVTTTMRVCTPGNGVVEAGFRANGEMVVQSVNPSNSCGTAVASGIVEVQKGAQITGLCGTGNHPSGGQCSMSLAVIGVSVQEAPM